MTGEPAAMQLAAAVQENGLQRAVARRIRRSLDLPGRARPQLDEGVLSGGDVVMAADRSALWPVQEMPSSRSARLTLAAPGVPADATADPDATGVPPDRGASADPGPHSVAMPQARQHGDDASTAPHALHEQSHQGRLLWGRATT